MSFFSLVGRKNSSANGWTNRETYHLAANINKIKNEDKQKRFVVWKKLKKVIKTCDFVRAVKNCVKSRKWLELWKSFEKTVDSAMTQPQWITSLAFPVIAVMFLTGKIVITTHHNLSQPRKLPATIKHCSVTHYTPWSS